MAPSADIGIWSNIKIHNLAWEQDMHRWRLHMNTAKDKSIHSTKWKAEKSWLLKSSQQFQKLRQSKHGSLGANTQPVARLNINSQLSTTLIDHVTIHVRARRVTKSYCMQEDQNSKQGTLRATMDGSHTHTHTHTHTHNKVEMDTRRWTPLWISCEDIPWEKFILKVWNWITYS